MRPKSFAAQFWNSVPHNAALGLETLSIEQDPAGSSRLRLPWGEHLLGDTERGLISTSAVANLVDSACGLAVLNALTEPTRIATLDLRIDYLRPSVGGLALMGRGHCFHTTRRIAFARGWVWQQDEERPVASAQGAFRLVSDDR